MKKLLLTVLFSISLLSIADASVSRFEFARQLQDAQCIDCYQADPISSEDEWEALRGDPGFSLDDLVYDEGDYFACVEQTVSQDLMQGYPRASSPFCPGRFCGGANIVAVDGAEAVINLMRREIAPDESLPVQSLLQTQQQTPFLRVDQLGHLRDAILRCEGSVCRVESLDELQLLISRWAQPSVSAPYAQTRRGRTTVLLRRLGIEWSGVQQYAPLTQPQIDELLSAVSRAYGCEDAEGDPTVRESDFDQDGVPDRDDTCPRSYDPLQYDQDGDGKGDVCDDDIDDDGVSNVLGVIDFQGLIDQTALLAGDDSTPGRLGPQIPGPLRVDPAVVTIGEPVTISAWPDTVVETGDGESLTIGSDADETTHSYDEPGTYVVTSEGQSQTVLVIPNQVLVGGLIVGGPLVQLVDQPSEFGVEIVGEGVETVLRDWDDQQELVTPGTQIQTSFDQSGTYPLTATLLDDDGDIIGTLQTTLTIIDSDDIDQNMLGDDGQGGQSILPDTDGTIESDTGDQFIGTQLVGPIIIRVGDQADYSTLWSGGSVGDIRYVQRSVDGTLSDTIYGDDTWSTVFTSPGVYQVSQTLCFVDRTISCQTNILQVVVVGDQQIAATLDAPTSILLGETIDAVLEFTQGGFDDLVDWTWYLDGVPTDQDGSTLQITPDQLGVIVISGYGTDQYGTPVYVQQPVQVVADDQCLRVGDYQCDMDGDGISDVCDSDIDGDEIPNPVGLITSENPDCSISDDIIDLDLLQETVGLEGNDVCPRDADPEQQDTNRDGRGDLCDDLGNPLDEVCYDGQDNDGDGAIDCADSDCTGVPYCQASDESETGSGSINGDLSDEGDIDGDGIPNSEDDCVYVPGIPPHGCPDLISGDGSDVEDNDDLPPACVTCPCEIRGPSVDLLPGDQVRALLYDETGTILYGETDIEVIRNE